jgi:hypothetical protein
MPLKEIAIVGICLTLTLSGCSSLSWKWSHTAWSVKSNVSGTAEKIAEPLSKVVEAIPVQCSPGAHFMANSQSSITKVKGKKERTEHGAVFKCL